VIRGWLTHRSRVPRKLRAAAALILAALAVLSWASPSPGTTGQTIAAPPTKVPESPGSGNPTKHFPSSPALIAEGHNLYEASCSSCHGVALQGVRGTAPSLRGVGPGPVDFYLSTGRMPLEQPREEPMRNRPLFTHGQIDALIAYVSTFGGPPAPSADPSKGDRALGFHEFTQDCAGCHQSVARGGMTLGAQVPNLQEASAQQIAEAVRMGPYLMPSFDSKQIDQHELDSIARYIFWTKMPTDEGGWGIYNIGPIPEGIVTWWIALASLVLVIRLIGERAA
jgi:ubiquinol-cytochrome c reductase cytochrome c subunit